jgi:hypothetical protein
MTSKISLITAIVGAALAFAVPAAWGDRWFEDQQQAGVRVSPDLADRAIAARQSELSKMLDAREEAFGVSVGSQVVPLEARERSLAAKREALVSSDFYADGFAQAVKSPETNSGPVRDDRFRLDPTAVPATVTATSPGREIEWPQIGIGLGLGIVLMLGLYLAMRYARIRPLAH